MQVRSILCMLCILFSLHSCKEQTKKIASSAELKTIFNNYWEDRMKLFPLEATATGDNRYNDKLPISISASYRDTLVQFYTKYAEQSKKINSPLNEEDEMSKELFDYEIGINLEGLQYPSHLMPINQFWSFLLEFPQLGSGDGNQPFKTVKDYDNFLQRIKAFPAWIDTAISNMQFGIKKGYILPRVLAEKMVPQFKTVVTIDPMKSIFYNPIHSLPNTFSAEEKKRLQNAYNFEIGKCIIPAYFKMQAFIEKEYIPACRETHGISSLPNGAAYYQYLIKNYTTTTLTPDSIYHLGLSEVARIKSEMEKVKEEVHFKGSLQEFFKDLNGNKAYCPFTTPKQVLDSFWAIKKIEDAHLQDLFESFPKTKFGIRQTEAYRAASASAEYNPGSADGSRPGIFYTPILDPRKFNIVGMETLFLHEAIPGHHFQISLQQENTNLPQFRKFLNYSAYAEGWALYTETLGKELGLYSNPYQYIGHLSDAMHRAIRLVVDVAIHTKGMKREEAIQFMMDNERITEPEAAAEIERYMAIPGQALSYKIGQLTISSMKEKYKKELGAKFDIKSFHTQLLDGGNMPLEVLQKKLDRWAKSL